jgi:uncharacterized protein YgiM (DUF1202 family)
MRLFIFTILVFFFSSVVTASEQYPYYASVAVAETFVRSGPGMEFYPTSQLWLGDKVEVYYETENWCAIRPPIGSFSWVSAGYVDLKTDNIGNVIADGLASRIGSETTTFCDTVQVKLKKGEKVFVIDRIETPENIASPLWFKIVPPRGEFRWVPREVLMPIVFPQNSKQTSKQTLKQIPSKQTITQVVYDYDDDVDDDVDDVDDVETGTGNKEIDKTESIHSLSARSGKSSTPQLTGLPASKISQTKKNITDLPPLSAKLASKQASKQSNQQYPMPYSAKETEINELKEFQKAFEELKEETRIVLTRPTEDWVFDTLIHRGSELYEIAPTDADLEKVYHLVETLQRTKTVRQELTIRRQFRNSYSPTSLPAATPYLTNTAANTAANTAKNTLANGYSGYTSNSGAPAPMNPVPMNPARLQSVQQSAQSVPKIPAATKIATAVKNPVTVPALTDSALTGKTAEFDLVGKLGEFQPLPKGHPPYALVNEKEEIICLVSPAAGVDLKSYSGKTVGINGILGIFEKPNQPNRRHILAREVEAINLK